MIKYVFKVVVHYEYNEDEDEYDKTGKSSELWIVASDDVAARKHAIKVTREWVRYNTYKGKITKVLYCEVELAGTIGGIAPDVVSKSKT